MDERPGLKASLSKIPEMINQHQFKLVINNSVQNEEINKIKPDLVAWLRKELKNTNIELVTEIEISQDQSYRPHTETEKLQEMLKKNPDLGLLSKKFDLNLGD